MHPSLPSKLATTALISLTLGAASLSGQTLVNDFELTNPFTGGLGTVTGASGSKSLLVGGQNDPTANADFSSQLNYDPIELGSQYYSVQMQLGIERLSTGNAGGFQFTQNGTLNNGHGPNFQFINGHDNGDFVFATGQGGSSYSTDDFGNSWSLGTPGQELQLGELFDVTFLMEFYYSGSGDVNSRQFDYSFTVTRSDPSNTVAVDSLVFTASKNLNPGGFTSQLGTMVFRGSGVGGFQGSLDNLIVSTSPTAVPEPSVAMFALMGIGLGWIRRRNRS